jgi:hypothetical protein
VGTLQKERLIDSLLRLRQAERSLPPSADIEAVRLELERILGPTVARATAARRLGVSQTALDRWVASGEIPVVLGRTARREVPLHVLLELIESVRQLRATTGAAEPHPLATVLRERRSRIQRLDIDAILPTRRPRHGHAHAELQGLLYHRALAAQLDEPTIREARHRLRRWREEERIDPRNANRWEDILSWPPTHIAAFIGRDSERSRQLRQSSPFAGALSEAQRRQVLAATDHPPS